MLTQIQIAAEAELELRKRQAERLLNFESQKKFYQTHPFEYMVERLGFRPETIDWTLLPEYADHKWDGTINPLKTILDCLALGVKRIGVESATGTGKTKLGAGIVLWFLECFDNSMIVTTAPKREQLSLHIWKEIGIMFNDFGKGELLLSLKLRMIPGQDNWIAVGFVAGVVANEESSTKAQGFHAEHLLVIFEETPGVPKSIMEAFQNTADGPHNIILAFGNPDHQLDNLHKFCNLSNVTAIRISGYDHPNVVTKNPAFIPGAVTLDGLNDKKLRYGGEDAPLFLSRAKGISPGQSIDALIRLEWISAAIERGKLFQDENGKFNEIKIDGAKALGVDVANSETGDKAAIAKGKGSVLLSVIDFQCPDANQLGKRDVLQIMNDEKISPDKVGVDSVGVGAGTVNALKEMNKKIIALGGADAPVKVNIDEKSVDKREEEYNNLRSQMYWQLREDLRNGIIALPNDQELIADLITPKWETKAGKIIVESKETIKKRLTHSPNKGDAVVYWNWVRQLKKPGLKAVSRPY